MSLKIKRIMNNPIFIDWEKKKNKKNIRNCFIQIIYYNKDRSFSRFSDFWKVESKYNAFQVLELDEE